MLNLFVCKSVIFCRFVHLKIFNIMNGIKNTKTLLLLVVYIFVIAFSKLMPHPDNFSPVLALAIFGGALFFRKKIFIAVTLAALFLSDFIFNNYIHPEYIQNKDGIVFFSGYMIWVYLSIIAVVLLASVLLRKFSYIKLGGTVLLSAVIFYLITNFGAWLSMPEVYTRDFSGLINSYVAAIPFFRASLVSNMIFSFIVFALYDIVVRYYKIKDSIIGFS